MGRFVGFSADTTLRLRSTGEQIRLMAAQIGFELVGLAVCAAVASVVLWHQGDHRALLAWVVALLAVGMARIALQRQYRRTSRDIQDSSHPRWARRFVACAALTGVVWCGVLLVAPAAAVTELGLLFAVSTGYLALASGVFGAYVPAFHAFAAPVVLAFLSVAVFRSDAQLVPQALVLMVIGVGSACHAHRQARFLARQIRLRYELREFNEECVAKRDQAELALLAKNRFLTTASHDLRQPVHAIGLYAALLESRMRDQDADGVLGKLQASIAGLTSLFDGILDVSKLDADGHHNVPQATAIDPLLDRLASEFDQQARLRGLSLSVDTSTGLVAHVDPVLLERVLTNLLGNAIKYTDQGMIDVKVEPQGDRLNLQVRDTGRGIAASESERIFTEYHQIRNTNGERSGGQGLGLAIVRQLCELMDVSIDLTSSPGQGTTFSLSMARFESSAGNMASRSRQAVTDR